MTVGELRRFLNTLPLDSDDYQVCMLDMELLVADVTEARTNDADRVLFLEHRS
ncbi:hypothetical protein [Streptomyces sparsogenes]|uniref:hypothetical protein n=1 Tax=Streptomyces sparsogenes TaxID=67365 RepID=UPI0033DBBC88